MRTFNRSDRLRPSVKDVHTEIVVENGRERSQCIACPDVPGGWPCPTLRASWDAKRCRTYEVQEALMVFLKASAELSLRNHAEELRGRGLADASLRALERARQVMYDEDAAWHYLMNLKEPFDLGESGEIGTFQVVARVHGDEICDDWWEWSGPRGVVIVEKMKDEIGVVWEDRHYMAVGKNKSHIGEEWDYARFYEVTPVRKEITAWSVK